MITSASRIPHRKMKCFNMHYINVYASSLRKADESKMASASWTLTLTCLLESLVQCVTSFWFDLALSLGKRGVSEPISSKHIRTSKLKTFSDSKNAVHQPDNVNVPNASL
jgi:hypothetical protein